MQSVHEQLRELFRRADTELFLWEFSVPPDAGGGTASFRMIDCMGYDIGLMRCAGTRVMCLTTFGVAYNRVDFYTGGELPDFLIPFTREPRPEEWVLVFGFADEELAEYSKLPVWEEQRLAYLVCESVEFQKRTGWPE